MRTTLNIADDILFAAKERARRQSRSLGEVLSELARMGLRSEGQVGANRQVREDEIGEAPTFYGFDPLPHRGPVVTNEWIDRLREEEPE